MSITSIDILAIVLLCMGVILDRASASMKKVGEGCRCTLIALVALGIFVIAFVLTVVVIAVSG